MDHDPLNYPRLLDRALRGVVRDALRQVADDGLPGEHHFYLTFHTGMPGVELPARLHDRYPNEMTIVLQNQFSDLTVAEQSFSVVLRFDGVPERLTIPFEAMIRFVDPAAAFGLQYELPASATGTIAHRPATTAYEGNEGEKSGRQTAPATIEARGNIVDITAFRKPRE